MTVACAPAGWSLIVVPCAACSRPCDLVSPTFVLVLGASADRGPTLSPWPRDYAGRVNPVAMYTLLRLGLFVAVLLLLYLMNARGLVAVILAAVISLALSYLLLGRQREAMATRLAKRVEEHKAFPIGKAEDDIAFEDALDDATRKEQGEDVP